MMARALLIVLFAQGLLFQLSRAVKLNCQVSHNGDTTTFIIVDSRVDNSDCEFSWINATNFTIADNSGKIPPVLESSINSLTTSQCVEGIVYKQECRSTATDYIATCQVNCSDNDFNDGEKDGKSKIWIGGAGAGAGAVAVAVAGFLCWKYRDKLWRKSGSCQCGGLYTGVKVQNDV